MRDLAKLGVRFLAANLILTGGTMVLVLAPSMFLPNAPIAINWRLLLPAIIGVSLGVLGFCFSHALSRFFVGSTEDSEAKDIDLAGIARIGAGLLGLFFIVSGASMFLGQAFRPSASEMLSPQLLESLGGRSEAQIALDQSNRIGGMIRSSVTVALGALFLGFSGALSRWLAPTKAP